METLFTSLKQTEALLLKDVRLDFKRFLHSKIDFSQRLIGIVGPRGVGKTTLLLQYLKEKYHDRTTSFYFSADNIAFQKGQLFELARYFHLHQGGTILCIDEIHRYPNWNQELKNIYDSFPQLKVIFSGSSSISLVKGKYDLSRRAVLYHLPGFSFREYLAFENRKVIAPISLSQLLSDHAVISHDFSTPLSILKDFRSYLNHGYYPFYRESSERLLYYQRIRSMVEKAIYEDISSVYRLKTESLPVFMQLLQFLASISPGEINAYKLSQALGKNHETIVTFLQILHEACLVRFLSHDARGHGLLRNAKKVFLDNPNLLVALNRALGMEPVIGTMRELYVLNQLQNAGHIPLYPKHGGDIVVDGTTFEIGGKKKGRKQIQHLERAFVLSDDIIVSTKTQLPLYLFGFLY